jgi:integrase
MPRALAIGAHGEIRTYYRLDNTWYPRRQGKPPRRPDGWKATALFRDTDGVVRQLSRNDSTETGAKHELRAYLAQRGATGHRTTATTRINDLADIYLTWIQHNPRRAGTTYDRYRGIVNNHIRPRMGDLHIHEATPGRINTVLQAIERDGAAPNTLRGIRACMSGIMQIAIDRDIITVNPVKSVRNIEGGAVRAAEAFDLDQLVDFLAKVDADEWAGRADLPDLIKFFFGTGVRFGEAIALRWGDCNLTDQLVTVTTPEGQRAKLPARSVWINGNLVRVTGRGVIRHSGKTAASRGIIGLPDFLHAILMQRRPTMVAAGAGVEQPVFPSPSLGWRSPSDVQRSIKRLRRRVGFPTFTTHVARKTVATLLSEAGQNSRQVADQLRQSSIQVTEKHYIKRGLANPAAARAIDAAHRPTQPTEPEGDGT